MSAFTDQSGISDGAPHPPMQGRPLSINPGSCTRDCAVAPSCRVLSIGDDPELLRTRELVLCSAGYTVVSVASELVSALNLNLFHVFVLCHELRTDKVSLLASIRTHANRTRILLLSDFSGKASLQGEIEIRPLPAILLTTLQQISCKYLQN